MSCFLFRKECFQKNPYICDRNAYACPVSAAVIPTPFFCFRIFVVLPWRIVRFKILEGGGSGSLLDFRNPSWLYTDGLGGGQEVGSS